MAAAASKLPGKNTVTAHAAYIAVVWDGPQDFTKMQATDHKVLDLADTFHAAHKPLLVALHVQNHPPLPNMGAFKEVIRMFRLVSLDRLVVSGDLSAQLMQLVSLVMKSFGPEFDVKYIADREAALRWLLSDTPAQTNTDRRG